MREHGTHFDIKCMTGPAPAAIHLRGVSQRRPAALFPLDMGI
jgi:hypothetical protein